MDMSSDCGDSEGDQPTKRRVVRRRRDKPVSGLQAWVRWEDFREYEDANGPDDADDAYAGEEPPSWNARYWTVEAERERSRGREVDVAAWKDVPVADLPNDPVTLKALIGALRFCNAVKCLVIRAMRTHGTADRNGELALFDLLEDE